MKYLIAVALLVFLLLAWMHWNDMHAAPGVIQETGQEVGKK